VLLGQIKREVRRHPLAHRAETDKGELIMLG
jgi:hypothetical protein